MYRFLALVTVLLAAGCGGGGAGFGTPTSTPPPATNTSTQAVAGTSTQQSETPTATATPPGTYTVAHGDTLWDIATRFNTTVEALVAANALANADDLALGQVLNIAPAAAAGTPTPTRAP